MLSSHTPKDGDSGQAHRICALEPLGLLSGSTRAAYERLKPSLLAEAEEKYVVIARSP